MTRIHDATSGAGQMADERDPDEPPLLFTVQEFMTGLRALVYSS